MQALNALPGGSAVETRLIVLLRLRQWLIPVTTESEEYAEGRGFTANEKRVMGEERT